MEEKPVPSIALIVSIISVVFLIILQNTTNWFGTSINTANTIFYTYLLFVFVFSLFFGIAIGNFAKNGYQTELATWIGVITGVIIGTLLASPCCSAIIIGFGGF